MQELVVIIGRLMCLGRPVAFWPYTSGVTHDDDHTLVAELDYRDDKAGRTYDNLMGLLVGLFRDYGIKSSGKWDKEYPPRADNKVVFEWELHGKPVYVGFYDGNVRVGTRMFSDYLPR